MTREEYEREYRRLGGEISFAKLFKAQAYKDVQRANLEYARECEKVTRLEEEMSVLMDRQDTEGRANPSP